MIGMSPKGKKTGMGLCIKARQPRIECHGARSFFSIYLQRREAAGRKPQALEIYKEEPQDAGRRGMWYLNTVHAASTFLLYRVVKDCIIGDTKGGGYPLP